MRGMPASKPHPFRHLYTRFSSGYFRMVGSSSIATIRLRPLRTMWVDKRGVRCGLPVIRKLCCAQVSALTSIITSSEEPLEEPFLWWFRGRTNIQTNATAPRSETVLGSILEPLHGTFDRPATRLPRLPRSSTSRLSRPRHSARPGREAATVQHTCFRGRLAAEHSICVYTTAAPPVPLFGFRTNGRETKRRTWAAAQR
jgi:hypothetical protein